MGSFSGTEDGDYIVFFFTTRFPSFTARLLLSRVRVIDVANHVWILFVQIAVYNGIQPIEGLQLKQSSVERFL